MSLSLAIQGGLKYGCCVLFISIPKICTNAWNSRSSINICRMNASERGFASLHLINLEDSPWQQWRLDSLFWELYCWLDLWNLSFIDCGGKVNVERDKPLGPSVCPGKEHTLFIQLHKYFWNVVTIVNPDYHIAWRSTAQAVPPCRCLCLSLVFSNSFPHIL